MLSEDTLIIDCEAEPHRLFLGEGKKGKSWTTTILPTWNRKVPNTEMDKFKKIIEEKYNTRFDSYWELHQWSVQNSTKFWEEMWNYVGVIASKPYKEVLVKTGPGFLDNEWFSGALLNYAENLLRNRDDSVAITCLDSEGTDNVTFAEMYDEVKLYVAAFRKNGLKRGDTVACYMSNRKEAIFAMLATTSIGAIWGGPGPCFGATVASRIVKMLQPKFLIAVDTHYDDERENRLVDNLPHIVNSAPSIEKVVLIATQEQTLKQDLGNIRHCVLLEDFLEEGRTPDGTVPDIVFEQLPFDHPVFVNFTSGTTGPPKGIVHSAGTFIAILRDYALHLNIKKGDVIVNNCPVGWSIWNYFVPCLALGCKLLLYCGNLYQNTPGRNWWDQVAKYNVKFTILPATTVDKFEKIGLLPSPDSNLGGLEIIGITASPVKKENLDYLRTKIKKDVFIGSIYGASEVLGTFSGFDLNMPVNGVEVQAPSLGTDIQCFNRYGESVVGKRGELVVCTPAPHFPIALWKDTNHEKLKSIYLSKYPGAWSQNDECWINPKTRGIVIIGRSDDTIKQHGKRFGSGDVYFAINSMEELQDYICVGQSKYNGDTRAVLFVKLKPGLRFTPELKAKIEQVIKDKLWEKFVPKVILPVRDIPYNLNGKRIESVVRKIVQTNKIPEVMSIKNPDSLKHFIDIPEIISYNQE